MHAALCFPFLLAASMAWAVPPVDSLALQRFGNDLLLTWPPAQGPVDGYRVYASDEITCASSVVLCQGPLNFCVIPDALADPGPGLYRVAAYRGLEEGPLTAPAYKYHVALAFWTGFVNDNLVAIPYNAPWADSLDACLDLNDGPDGSPIPLLIHLVAERSQLWMQSCGSSLRAFRIVPGRGIIMKPQTVGIRVPIYGSGHPGWPIDFSAVGAQGSYCSSAPGEYLVSLPFDHAYSDLAALAAEIPHAVEVQWMNPVRDAPWCHPGLTRATSADPWGGENVSLLDKRGQGVMVVVDAPGSWSPRRLCGTPGQLAPPRVNGLLVARAGSAAGLHWTAEPLAVGGYDVYRLEAKATLPATLSQGPWLQVPGAAPAFPVLDAGAVRDPSALLFYQVAGRSADGVRSGI